MRELAMSEKQKRADRLAMLADLYHRGRYSPDLTALARALLEKEPQLFCAHMEGRPGGTARAKDRKTVTP